MFYIIYKRRKALEFRRKALERLLKASRDLGVEVEVLDIGEFDSEKYNFKKTDCGYRIGSDMASRVLEDYMLDCGVRFLRQRDKKGKLIKLNRFEIARRYQENGVKVVPTEYFPADKEEVLIEQVKRLGGFPIVVKENGSSSGAGVVRVDSMSSLMSVLSMVKTKAKGEVVLKQYIEHKEQARLIVVGDRVVAEKANLKNGSEIRLNTGWGFVESKREYAQKIRDMAVKAVRLIGLEFGGVDILLAKDGSFYLAEVNMPCAFTYTEDVSGKNVAREIVSYLTAKEK